MQNITEAFQTFFRPTTPTNRGTKAVNMKPKRSTSNNHGKGGLGKNLQQDFAVAAGEEMGFAGGRKRRRRKSRRKGRKSRKSRRRNNK